MTSREVAKKLGVPFRTLHGWRERGLLTPTQVSAPGMPCEWTEKDIREARTIVALRQAGFSAQGIRKAQDYLRSLGFNPFSRGQVAVILGSKGKPQDLIKIVDEKTAFQLLRERGQLVMLSLAGLEADETGRTEVARPVGAK